MLFALVFRFFMELRKPLIPKNVHEEERLRSAQDMLASRDALHAVRLEQLRAALF